MVSQLFHACVMISALMTEYYAVIGPTLYGATNCYKRSYQTPSSLLEWGGLGGVTNI